ncbi:hypothetical protein D3C86_1632820 [compost metagenome]
MMTADQRRMPTCSFRNTTDMMVTKEGRRKISAKASAMERWVKAVTLPTAPVPAAKKRMIHKGRFVVFTTSTQRSLRLRMKGRATSPNRAPKKADSIGEIWPSMSLTLASLQA